MDLTKRHERLHQMLYRYAFGDLDSGLRRPSHLHQIYDEVLCHIKRELVTPLESDLYFSFMESLSTELGE